MANAIVNRQVNIYIESGQAQKALNALVKKENELKDALNKATDPKQVQRLTGELKKLEEPIERARKKLSGELSASFRDVQSTVNSLGNRLKRMSQEDADFSTVVAQYQQANAELEAQKGKVGLLGRAMRSFWQEAKTVAVGVVIGNTVQSMLQTVMGYVTGMVTGSAQIADELSDIEKTTNLTKEQVAQINSELKKIDTRTSSSELRKLASEAGKLGKESVEDVVKFVNEADKIRVALGEDLGDDAIISIGKLSKIFKTGMLEIGSAINEIGASSEASERFAVDFLNRLAGTGPAVGLAAGDLLGYGAALEVAGQTAEVSGTALSTFLIDFVRESEKFGKAAGFANGELTKLIQEKGTNAGFIEFLTRLKQANPDAQQFLTRMQELGVDGARGANVMLVLSNNIQSVKDQQLIANEAIKSNASIMEEFNKKNNNAAAELDKLKKNFAGLFTSSTIMDAGAGAVRVLNNFVNVLKGIPEFIKENRSALALLAAGIVLLNKQYLLSALVVAKDSVAKAANAVITRATAVASNIAAAAQAVYIALTMRTTATLTLARRAQIAWNAAMSVGAGPLGAILVIAGALVIAIANLVNNTQRLSAAQKLQGDVQQKVVEATRSQIDQVQALTRVVQDNTLAESARAAALAKLVQISPEYLKGLTLENVKTQEGIDIINNYIKALKAKATMQAKADIYAEAGMLREKAFAAYRAMDPRLAKQSDAQVEAFFRQKNKTKALFGDVEVAGFKTKEVVSAMDQINLLQKEVDDFTTKNIIEEVTNLSTGTSATMGKLEGSTVKLSKAENKVANDLKQLAEELKKISLALMPDETLQQQFEKQLAALDEKYAALREKAHGNVKLLKQIDDLYRQERDLLYAEQAAKFKEVLDKESATNKRIAAERATNLKNLMPLTAKVGDSAVRLSGMIGRSEMAKAELDVIKSNGRDKLDAELRLLELQRKEELNGKELTENEKLLIEEKYREKRKEAEINFYVELASQVLNYANQVLGVFTLLGEAKTQRENEELARDKAANDKKKKNLEDRLKNGLVSQKQYDAEVAKMDKAAEKKEKETRLKQFKRDQRAQIAQALMSGAMAVVNTLAARPGSLDIISLGAFRAINIGLAVATTAAQVAKIASAKPPQYGRGGYMRGPSHADSSQGLPIVNPYTGQVQAYVEGGEGITNRRTMADGRRYSVSGTPSQIISSLNALHGGVSWQGGATLRPLWSTQKPQALNISSINTSLHAMRRMYAAGGVLGAEAAQPGKESSAGDGMQHALEVLTAAVVQLQQQMQQPLKAYTVLSEQEAQQQRLARIRAEATMR